MLDKYKREKGVSPSSKSGDNRVIEKNKTMQFLLPVFRIMGLIILCIIIASLSEHFLSTRNIINILRHSSPRILMAVGMTMVLLTGGIDLSIGSVMTVGGVVSGFFLTQTTLPWPVALFASLIVGIVLGMLNGLMVSKIRIPPPIATYGMLWVARGIAFGIMGATPFYGFSCGFRFIGGGSVLGIPFPIIIMVVLVIICFLFLKYTIAGRSLYVTGANQSAAKASGIKVDRTLIIAYTVSGFMAALAGVILCARLNAVDQDIGAPYLLPTIAAPVMGGVSMGGGQGGVTGAIIGSLILVVLTNGMNLLGVSSLWQPFVIGIVVVLAVWLDVSLKRKG